ncbi:MAG TPA: DUF1194 domain-containing protein [Micropepsaceae bacterium]|jgi:hypothetical protein|nr:DUF1194 domain-containing protein [Micropepsaceae bacterium]
MKFFARSILTGSILSVIVALPVPSRAAQQQVDLKLVLAMDVSGSIDNDELQLEREGTADAFLDPQVIQAIQNGSVGRIAVAMVDFSMTQYNKIVVDWHIIRDRASAAAFAELVRKTPRTLGHRTSISSALQLGSLLLESSDKDITATRKVIDVSGDGANNAGDHMTPVHDKTIANGIIVNGLPVMDERANGYFPDLDKYYAACVAGGKGSFVVVVRNYKDYSVGMRRKLVLEISRNDIPLKPQGALLHRVAAAAAVQPGQSAEILRSGPNEFSKQCDNVSGPFSFGNF